jgi:hypothetical protein
MSNLVSGMILVTKEYGDLYYYIDTPYGPKVIDVNAYCIDFDLSNYEKAYIPKNYGDPWTPAEGTEIMLTEVENQKYK